MSTISVARHPSKQVTTDTSPWQRRYTHLPLGIPNEFDEIANRARFHLHGTFSMSESPPFSSFHASILLSFHPFRLQHKKTECSTRCRFPRRETDTAARIATQQQNRNIPEATTQCRKPKGVIELYERESLCQRFPGVRLESTPKMERI